MQKSRKFSIHKPTAIDILSETLGDTNKSEEDQYRKPTRNFSSPCLYPHIKNDVPLKADHPIDNQGDNDHNYYKQFKTARTTFMQRKQIQTRPNRPSGPQDKSYSNNDIWQHIYKTSIQYASYIFWCLSRLYKFKTYTVLILFLSILSYLLHETISDEPRKQWIKASPSNIVTLFFTMSDRLLNLFSYNEDFTSESIPEEISCTEKILSILYFIWFVALNFISNIVDKSYSNINKIPIISNSMAFVNSNLKSISAKISPKKEEFKSIANEVIEERLKNILEQIQTAHFKYQLSTENILSNKFKNATDRNSNFSNDILDDWIQLKLNGYNKKSLQELKATLEKNYSRTGIKHTKNIQRTVEKTIRKYLKTLGTNITYYTADEHLSDKECSSNSIQKLVKEAILIYDADKTGLFDYALESAGGSIVSTRCAENYYEKSNKFSIFGIKVWTVYTSPRKAIQPSMQPGQCWAFKGNQGFLVIKLSYTIDPTAFSLEHIPISLSPSGSIDSAPKEFSVWGLTLENDKEGKLLGNYSYTIKGLPLQYFPVENTYNKSFPLVELRIHSNHGNLEYTCLYRFRVHGNRAK